MLPALACLIVCSCGFAQDEANPYPMPTRTVQNGTQPAPASKPAPAQPPTPAARPAPQPAARPAPQPAKPSPAVPAPAPATSAAPSLLSQPAQPAKVSLASGKLTVEAKNSSLSGILSQIAKSSGMKIDGLPANAASQRIFGRYGPGSPREVLSDLLTGSGYNVLMVGVTPAGTPRLLTLSARAGGVSNPPAQPAANQDEENDEDIQPTQYPDEQNNQPQPPPASNVQNRVRTPQQILQELQRMRQQQQQRQPR